MTIRRSEMLKSRIMVAGRSNHISVAYSDALLARMNKDGEHHGYEHARLRDWRQDLRDKHQAFAIVRNPWSRVVSRWTFYKVLASRGRIGMPTGYTFSDFLEERHQYGNREFYWHRAIRGWYPQHDYIVGGKINLLRLEHLDVDAKRLFKLSGPLNPRNISNGVFPGIPTDYRAYYSESDYKIIAEWYAVDIDYFGFTFESAATKNCLYGTD